MSLSLAAASADATSIRCTLPSAWSAASKEPDPSPDELVLHRAEQILFARLSARRLPLGRSEEAIAYLKVRLGGLEREQFDALWLNRHHRLLHVETLARGTIDQVSVYSREVVKAALHVNAAAVIFAHNHPGGLVEPSWDDRALTRRLKDALGLIDIRTVDHIVIAGNESLSFVDRGWL